MGLGRSRGDRRGAADSGDRSGRRFELVAIYDDRFQRSTMGFVNPAIVVRNWNQPGDGIALKIAGATLRQRDGRKADSELSRGRNNLLFCNWPEF